MRTLLVTAIVVTILISHADASESAKNLFILSGQSNMEWLDPDESFRPAVKAAFGRGNVIIVKDAEFAQPIRRWCRNWKPAAGEGPKSCGDLYDRLMTKVRAAIKDKKVKTVTLIWMQGEQDALEKNGKLYAASLNGLINQISEDLGQRDIYFVIGRLGDFDLANRTLPHWTLIRDAQVSVAEANKNGAWVDTDDLNDGMNRQGIRNGLHYSPEGYKILGQRFAEKAIALINRNGLAF